MVSDCVKFKFKTVLQNLPNTARTLSGKRLQKADSASGGFSRQIPPLPVTLAVETVEKGANLP
jgi:hypothetical protein